MKLTDTAKLVTNLQNKSLFHHEVTEFKVVETHVSYVLLTGPYAYKIKKPVDFGFLNFLTLEQRKFYCEQEFALNRKIAADLYVDVIPIYGTIEHPCFDISDSSTPIEYAVKMKQFAEQDLLIEKINDNQLDYSHLEQIAKKLAEFHLHTDQESPSFLGTYSQIYEPVAQNFEQIREFITNEEQLKQLIIQENWVNQIYQELKITFEQRKKNGFIRDCHGDCHLGNIIWQKDKPIFFDRIEFNDSFRFTDTYADVAFLYMDLCDKGFDHLAVHFINYYLVHSGDYEGVSILPFYAAYRAIVRAKIQLFEIHFSQQLDAEQKTKLMDRYNHLISLANRFAKNTLQPNLIITYGFTGSGKTTQAIELSKKLHAIHLRSDVIRKQLFGIDINKKILPDAYQGIFSSEHTEKTYNTLLKYSQIGLAAGFPVIIDASFLQYHQRTKFYDLARQMNLHCQILACDAEYSTLLNRLENRNLLNNDFSEGRTLVLDAQMRHFDPLTKEEKTKILRSV